MERRKRKRKETGLVAIDTAIYRTRTSKQRIAHTQTHFCKKEYTVSYRSAAGMGLTHTDTLSHTQTVRTLQLHHAAPLNFAMEGATSLAKGSGESHTHTHTHRHTPTHTDTHRHTPTHTNTQLNDQTNQVSRWDSSGISFCCI